MPRKVEEIRLTPDMLLSLMQGKDVWLILNAENEDERIEFRFKGPYDGVFLTHEEIRRIQYSSEMGVINLLDKIRNNNIEEYLVKSEE